MDQCENCLGTDFITRDGYFWCAECGVRVETKKEEDVEFNTNSRTRVTKTKIKRPPFIDQKNDRTLTSWETFNYVLLGLVDELIAAGVSSEKFKLTVAQLWCTYLAKLEVAFISTKDELTPRLSLRYEKKDAELVFGKTFQRKKKKSKKAGSDTSGSVVSKTSSVRDMAKRKKMFIEADYLSQTSNMDSETSLSQTSGSDSDGSSVVSAVSTKGIRLQFNKLAQEEKRKLKQKAADKPRHVRGKLISKWKSITNYYGPDSITPLKLWAIIFLALRVNNENIHISDMLRLAKDGHLSYYKLDHFIPMDFIFTTSEAAKLNNQKELSITSFKNCLERLKKFLNVYQIPNPNLLALIKQYCKELQLPSGIVQYAERVLAAWPPDFDFNSKTILLPHYEARAMAIIIVVMKILFGLDGVTENEMSRVIERINEVAIECQVLDSKLFSFREWQRYIECRRRILINEHCPTKIRYDPYSPGNSHLFTNFLDNITTKFSRNNTFVRQSLKNRYKPVPLWESIQKDVAEMARNFETKSSKIFHPSLTPQHSYLQELLDDTEDPDRYLPSILREDFPNSKIGYIRNPESLKKLAAQCDIELNIVYSSASYVRKVMQVFEPHTARIIVKDGERKTHNTLTRVTAPNDTTLIKNSDDPSEYLHRKRPGKILIESKKQRLFNKMMKLYDDQRKKSSDENNQTLQNQSDANNQTIEDQSCAEINENPVEEKYNPINQDNDYFGFDQLLPDGKLKIVDFDTDSDSDTDVAPKKPNKLDNILLSNFEKQSIENPIPNPWNKKKRFQSMGFAWRGDEPPPEKYSKKSLYWKKRKQMASGEINTVTNSVPTTTKKKMSAEEKRLYWERRRKLATGEVTDDTEFADIIVEDQNKEKMLIDEDTVVIIDQNPANIPINDNKEPSEAIVVVIDENEDKEVIPEDKNTNDIIVELTDEDEKTNTAMEIDLEAIEDKSNTKSKNTVDNEPETLNLSDDAEEIIINDETDDESDKEVPAKEITIEDSSSDDEVSILTESIDSRPDANHEDSSPEKELLTLYIPYKQYWLYRCVEFGAITPKHYHLFEQNFSNNFRWLLHECANMIESRPIDLYKEICVVEGYYTDILAPDEHMEKCEEYNTKWYRTQQNRTTVKRKWNQIQKPKE